MWHGVTPYGRSWQQWHPGRLDYRVTFAYDRLFGNVLILVALFTHIIIVQSDLFLSHAKEKYNFTSFDRGWFHWICVLHGCILYFFGSKRFAGLQMWTCQQSGPQSSSHGVIGVVMPKRFTDNRMGSNANPVSTMCTWNTWAVRKTWLFEY